MTSCRTSLSDCGRGKEKECYSRKQKKRKRECASILHDKSSRTCYLCVALHDNWNEHRILDEHHVFGGPNRKNSEEYGLKVYLCNDHHIYGPEAVHNNARIRHEMQRMAQREFEKRYGHAKFMEVFGRNFLGPSGENDEEMVRADRKRD